MAKQEAPRKKKVSNMNQDAESGKCDDSRFDSKLTVCDGWTYDLEAGDIEDGLLERVSHFRLALEIESDGSAFFAEFVSVLLLHCAALLLLLGLERTDDRRTLLHRLCPACRQTLAECNHFGREVVSLVIEHLEASRKLLVEWLDSLAWPRAKCNGRKGVSLVLKSGKWLYIAWKGGPTFAVSSVLVWRHAVV